MIDHNEKVIESLQEKIKMQEAMLQDARAIFKKLDAGDTQEYWDAIPRIRFWVYTDEREQLRR